MRIITPAMIAISLLSASNVWAEDAETESFMPSTYYSLHIGRANAELVSGGQDFNYTQLGGSWGYQYSESLSVEMVASISIGEQTDDIVSAMLGQKVGTSYTGLGGYLVGKTSGQFYAKGKLGLAMSQFIYSASGFEDESENTFGLSYGFGFGVQMEKMNLEFEYTVMPEADDPLFSTESYDVDMMTLNFVFNY